MKDLLKVIRVAGELGRVAAILDPHNGDLRWRMLQDWLNRHPEYKAVLLHTLTLSPAAAVNYIGEALDLDIDGLASYDPTGTIRAKTENTIQLLQDLYKERAAQNALG